MAPTPAPAPIPAVLQTGTGASGPPAASQPPAIPPRKQKSWDALDVTSMTHARLTQQPPVNAAAGHAAAAGSAAGATAARPPTGHATGSAQVI